MTRAIGSSPTRASGRRSCTPCRAPSSLPSVDAVVLDSFLVPPTAAAYSEAIAGNGSERVHRSPSSPSRATLLAEAGVAGAEVCVLYDPADPVRVREFELIRDAAAPAGFRVTDCSNPDWMRMLGRGGAYDAVLLSCDLTSLEPGVAAGALLRSDSTIAEPQSLRRPGGRRTRRRARRERRPRRPGGARRASSTRRSGRAAPACRCSPIRSSPRSVRRSPE